jgi:hypothetical protein
MRITSHWNGQTHTHALCRYASDLPLTQIREEATSLPALVGPGGDGLGRGGGRDGGLEHGGDCVFRGVGGTSSKEWGGHAYTRQTKTGLTDGRQERLVGALLTDGHVLDGGGWIGVVVRERHLGEGRSALDEVEVGLRPAGASFKLRCGYVRVYHLEEQARTRHMYVRTLRGRPRPPQTKRTCG